VIICMRKLKCCLHVQAVCQNLNFSTMMIATWGCNNLGAKYQLSHALNSLMSAVNFLPGQVGASSAPVGSVPHDRLYCILYLPMRLVKIYPAHMNASGEVVCLQVRVSFFLPVLAVQSVAWVMTGATSRRVNPLHAGPPLSTCALTALNVNGLMESAN
jgi:hypothetical protein